MFRFEAFKPVRTRVLGQVSKKTVFQKKLFNFGGHIAIFLRKQLNFNAMQKLTEKKLPVSAGVENSKQTTKRNTFAVAEYPTWYAEFQCRA